MLICWKADQQMSLVAAISDCGGILRKSERTRCLQHRLVRKCVIMCLNCSDIRKVRDGWGEKEQASKEDRTRRQEGAPKVVVEITVADKTPRATTNLEGELLFFPLSLFVLTSIEDQIIGR